MQQRFLLRDSWHHASGKAWGIPGFTRNRKEQLQGASIFRFFSVPIRISKTDL